MIGYLAKDGDSAVYIHEEYPKYDKNYDGWFSANMFEIPYKEHPEFQSITKPVKVELNIKILDND